MEEINVPNLTSTFIYICKLKCIYASFDFFWIQLKSTVIMLESVCFLSNYMLLYTQYSV